MSHILEVKARFENGGQLYYKGDKIHVRSGERAKELERKGLAKRIEPPAADPKGPQEPTGAQSPGPSETQDTKPDETKEASELASTIDQAKTHKELDAFQEDYLLTHLQTEGKNLNDRKALIKQELGLNA